MICGRNGGRKTVIVIINKCRINRRGAENAEGKLKVFLFLRDLCVSAVKLEGNIWNGILEKPLVNAPDAVIICPKRSFSTQPFSLIRT